VKVFFAFDRFGYQRIPGFLSDATFKNVRTGGERNRVGYSCEQWRFDFRWRKDLNLGKDFFD